MTDVFTSSKRSWIMGRVHGKDTKPEIIVRSVIHRMGFRFRLHVRAVPGCPDIVLPKHGKVVFVHGCFWHGHRGCSRASIPSTRKAFWNKKLSGNAERDARNLRELRRSGLRVLVIWECETKNRKLLERKLRRFLIEKKEATNDRKEKQ
jgi:DNA mismatch endonuclease (patch repair protein)